MYRKLIVALLLIAGLASESLAVQKLKQSTATTINLDLVTASTGAALTGATVTNIAVSLVKHSDTSSSAKTDLTITAAAGSNDVVEVGKGAYNLELTTTDTGTLGRLDVCYTYTNAISMCDKYQVVAAASYDNQVGGDVASVADIYSEPVPGSYTAGQAGYIIGNNLRYAVTGTADSGSTTTVVDTERTEADTDYWVPGLIVFTSGTISGQARYITGFNAATDTITFAPAVTQSVGVNTYEIRPLPDFLRPTVSGRTIDVTATGGAGIDWANVEAPTTVVGLSGTTVKTATDVETDTQDIQTRLPAALVSGRIDSSVGAMAANTLTAAATAADFTVETNTGLLTVPKNTAYSNFTFEMVDATDGQTLELGLTVTCEVSKDGAVLGACTNAVSEVGSGLYKVALAAGDLNADEVWLRFTATGARRLSFKIRTQK